MPDQTLGFLACDACGHYLAEDGKRSAKRADQMDFTRLARSFRTSEELASTATTGGWNGNAELPMRWTCPDCNARGRTDQE